MGYLDGLGDLQTQHSCVLLLDITENCNLQCPTCFAESSPGVARHAPIENILRTLDTMIERENGRIDVLMLSGGEPTVHPQIMDILRETAKRRVERVIINTNGLRIARDNALVDLLGSLRGRLEVYLQFDGFDLDSHLFHRGEDLRAMKREAIERLTGSKVFTTLAMAVAHGVNDREVGRVAEYAFATDYIGGVAFQPVFGSGRSGPIDIMDRLTTTGTLKRLAAQTGGTVGPDDFIALPCSHPDCCAIAYFVIGDEGQFNSVTRLLGKERLKANLDLVSNRIAADEAALGQALMGMMSETTTITRPELIDYVLTLCDNCDLGLSGLLRRFTSVVLKRELAAEPVSKRLKRLTIKSFMDAYTLNMERLQQCCVHVGSTDGDANPVRIPFCARQLFGDLRRKTSAGQVPAQQLIPLQRSRKSEAGSRR
jgi:uncharacterized radical SAM superfamily Fe-S cluster-containing enzyme